MKMAVRSWPLEEILYPENLDLEADLEDERYFERDLDDERYLERDLDENLPPPLPPPLPPLASINAIAKNIWNVRCLNSVPLE